MRQCHPGRTGVSKSSCVIFFEEQSESLPMLIQKNQRGLDLRKFQRGSMTNCESDADRNKLTVTREVTKACMCAY